VGEGRASAVESAPPAEPPPTPEERVAVARIVLGSCARQGFPWIDAWRVACDVAANGLAAREAADLLLALRPNRERWRVAYLRAVERHASRGSGHASHDAAPAPTR
jgi:hypothetical protein